MRAPILSRIVLAPPSHATTNFARSRRRSPFGAATPQRHAGRVLVEVGDVMGERRRERISNRAKPASSARSKVG